MSTVAAIPPALGRPGAAALDGGYYSRKNIDGLAAQQMEPYLATGRDAHHRSWQERFEPEPEPPGALWAIVAQPVRVAYKLKTALGKAIYEARKSTVEPVMGIIKETLGFRQFSLRGETAAAAEWQFVCLAYNLKRFHKLSIG